MRKEELQMGILDELLSGGQRQKEFRDFVNRYEQGHPSEGYSDQEVLKRYGELSHAVPPDQYAKAAQEALGKLSPEERAAFVRMLQERAAVRGVTLSREVQPEPRELGQILADLHQKPWRSARRRLLPTAVAHFRGWHCHLIDDGNHAVSSAVGLGGQPPMCRSTGMTGETGPTQA
jgi:hypothetical protein